VMGFPFFRRLTHQFAAKQEREEQKDQKMEFHNAKVLLSAPLLQ